MTVTEVTRHQLYKRLEDILGTDDANTLMEHLPPLGWGEVATKAETERGFAATKAEMERGFAAAKDDIAALRTDMDALEVRMGLRLDKTIAEALHRQFVQIIASTAVMLTVMLSLAVTVNQLLGG